MHLHRAGGSIGHQVGVGGEEFLDQSELVVAVGEAVMDVERRLGLAVADDHPQVDQRDRLVEQRLGCLGVGSVEFDDLDARVQQIVEHDLPAAVRVLLEVPAQHGMGLQQQIEGVRQRVDVDVSLDVGGEPDEVLGLGEHLLAARELPNCR
jgi:hypothetical protein